VIALAVLLLLVVVLRRVLLVPVRGRGRPRGVIRSTSLLPGGFFEGRHELQHPSSSSSSSPGSAVPSASDGRVVRAGRARARNEQGLFACPAFFFGGAGGPAHPCRPRR
jgi:hypothetical protein